MEKIYVQYKSNMRSISIKLNDHVNFMKIADEIPISSGKYFYIIHTILMLEPFHDKRMLLYVKTLFYSHNQKALSFLDSLLL